MSTVESWLSDHLPPPGTGLALDVGANVGAWTVELASRCDDVHAFEPNPQTYSFLRLGTANLDNVRLFDLAIGEAPGDLNLHLYGNSSWASFYREDELDAWREGEPRATISVPVASLDSLGYGNRPVEFIKIDVEGGECSVLEGARRTLDGRPNLLVEIHTLANRDWVVGLLSALDYEPRVVKHPHPGVPDGHCWVVAKSP